MKTIPLTQGKEAMVDDEDFDFLSQWKWCAKRDKNTWYAEHWMGSKSKPPKISMHRMIMKATEGAQIDHKDGNGLNNCRSNLRFCNHAQNCQNARKIKNCTSNYKGISWNGYSWRVQISINNTVKHVGCYKNETDAANAYDKAAHEQYGKFAKLNFPAKPEQPITTACGWSKHAPARNPEDNIAAKPEQPCDNCGGNESNENK